MQRLPLRASLRLFTRRSWQAPRELPAAGALLPGALRAPRLLGGLGRRAAARQLGAAHRLALGAPGGLRQSAGAAHGAARGAAGGEPPGGGAVQDLLRRGGLLCAAALQAPRLLPRVRGALGAGQEGVPYLPHGCHGPLRDLQRLKRARERRSRGGVPRNPTLFSTCPPF